MTGYDLDVVEVGDRIRLEFQGTVYQGKVIRKTSNSGGDATWMELVDGDEMCDIVYDSGTLERGDYSIELLEWDDS